MIRISDGKQTVEIEMRINNGPDFSYDFFDIRQFPHDDETDTYTVPDVEYCIEQALDWKFGRGDYYDGDPRDHKERIVFVR